MIPKRSPRGRYLSWFDRGADGLPAANQMREDRPLVLRALDRDNVPSLKRNSSLSNERFPNTRDAPRGESRM